MTITPPSSVTRALDELVATLVAVDLPATRDPGDFQPPGAIVTPPTISGPVTLGTIGLEVPVWIVADRPGIDAQDWLLSAAVDVLLEMVETTASPTLWISPINPEGLPAYLVTVRMQIAP